VRKICWLSLVMVIILGLPVKSLAFENSKLVEIAKKYNGVTFKPPNKNSLVGQCKWFVQKVIREAGGSLGTGYRFCYDPDINEIKPEEATAGDIIQLDDPNKNHNKKVDGNKSGKEDNYTYPMHTAIIIENRGNGNYLVIDSNYKKDLTVRIHSFNPWQLAGNKLHVHFYRLGEISKPSVQPPKEQPVPHKNITVVIGIDDTGSMTLNDPQKLRAAAAKYFIDLLQNDDKVAVFSFGDKVQAFQPLTEISSDRKKIKDSIYLLSSQATNMDLAFAKGYEELQKDSSENPKFFIFLTDGRHAPKSNMLYKGSHLALWGKGWKIYSIFLMSSSSPTSFLTAGIDYVPDPEFLKMVTGEQEGKGKFFESPSPKNLQEIYSEISKLVQGQKIVFSPDPFILKPQEEKTFSFTVPQQSYDLQVVTTWPGSKVSTDLYEGGNFLNSSGFLGPNYQIINITNASSLRNKEVTLKVRGVEVAPQGEQVYLVVRSKVDEIPPEVKISTPEYSKTPLIKVKSHDNIEVKEVRIFYFKNKDWILAHKAKENEFQHRLKIDDGIYPLKVEAEDEVGNIGSVFRNIIVDTQKPRVLLSVKQPSWFKKASIKIKVQDSSFKILRIQDGQKMIKREESSFGFYPKASKIFISAEDKAGNKKVEILKIKNKWWQKLWESILDTFRLIFYKVSNR